MKNPPCLRLLSVLLLATAATAFAEPEVRKDVIIHRGTVKAAGPQFRTMSATAPLEMEKVAYLGVETMPVDPTVAAQLGLPRGTGIVVRRVADGSPADGVLQPHDILTRLDDQILVNMAQLTVLARNHQAGDEVKLTYLRGGKESVAKVKLAEREIPKLAWEAAAGGPAVQFFGHSGPFGSGAVGFSHAQPAIPVLPPDEAGNVMRVIGGDRPNWFAHPRVHVMRRGGAGSTILDLAAGNFVYSDEQGFVEVNATGGKRELTVKDKDGKVTFQGPINSPEEHAKLPPEVKDRLEAIGGAEIGTDAGGIEIETKVFEPAAKIRFELPEPANEAPAPGMRTL